MKLYQGPHRELNLFPASESQVVGSSKKLIFGDGDINENNLIAMYNKNIWTTDKRHNLMR